MLERGRLEALGRVSVAFQEEVAVALEKKKAEQVLRRKWKALQRRMMALAARAVQARVAKEWLRWAEGVSGLGRALRVVQRSRRLRRSV